MRYFDDDAEYAQEQQECGSSEKPNNLLSEKQEPPEVDLEKEINSYCGTRDIRPVPDFMDAVARHFYELGFNARKEE